MLADHNLGPHSISGVEAVFRIRELVGFPVPVIMLTAVQGAEVVGDFQRAMHARMALNPSMVSAIARSRTEEPPVLQKPTTAAVLNNRTGRSAGNDHAAGGTPAGTGRQHGPPRRGATRRARVSGLPATGRGSADAWARSQPMS